jgi:hypothetical protein
MSARKAITLRLELEDYKRLEVEAKRLGVQLGTLARMYVRAGLTGNIETEMERKRRIGLEAVDHLTELTADLPTIDAVQVTRESREDLERRSFV